VSTELLPATGPAGSADVEAVIVGLVQGESAPELADGAAEVAAAFGEGRLIELLSAVGATGKAEEIVKIPTGGAITAPLLVAAGLGKPVDDGDRAVLAERVRRASGAAARALAGKASARNTLGAIDAAAAGEGSVLGAYTFSEYRSSDGKAPLSRVEVDGDAAAIERAATVAAAVVAARDLINTPPNDLYPATFAERAAALATEAGVAVEVLDEKALADGGYGGILGVGQGSTRPPRLVRLTWSGGDAPRAKVALVGKGITFDTGGISIKPAANMDHMTSDMSGAAAVIVTTVLAARLNLPVAVTATVPMAENLPSGSAYRPGDVLRMYSGKTVEVLNTDAEGRLILADAIARAAEDSPDLLVEVSTLTGAQQVALGMRTAGVMGSDELRDRIAALGRAVGEDAWAMPLPEHLREGLDSRIADIANAASARWGGMLSAGIFLREFVPAGLPWAHIDIAGPSFNSNSPWGYTPKGGTGVPVRTLAALLQELAEA